MIRMLDGYISQIERSRRTLAAIIGLSASRDLRDIADGGNC
jgi:hypothetical protein